MLTDNGPVMGVILAGGRASRLGFREKALVELQGRPLVSHVIERLATQVDGLWLNVNREQAHYQRFGLPIIGDAPAFTGMGPLAGIHAALEAFERHTPSDGWLAVAACDSPWLPVDLVDRLIAAARTASLSAAVAYENGGAHPTFSVLHSSLLPSVDRQLRRNELAFGRWLADLPAAQADFSDQPEAFGNLNTIAELEAANRSLPTTTTCVLTTRGEESPCS